jgi:FkbM family methyltransferase
MIPIFVDRLLLASPPSVAKHYRAYKWWRWGEPEVHLVPALCDRRRISVDVGASRGFYSYFMGRKSRRCLAFEPNPELHSQLRSQVVNTTVYGYALSDHCGTAELRIPMERGRVCFGAATIEPANQSHGKEINIEIETKTLDSFGIRDVGFIKVDTEGHELAFLEGAKSTIQNSKPRMLIEAEDRHRPGAIASVANFLNDHNYLGFFLCEGKLEPICRFEPGVHQQRGSEAGYIANFLFLHVSDALLSRNWQGKKMRFNEYSIGAA